MNNIIMTLNIPVDQRAHPYAVPGELFLIYRPQMQMVVKVDNLGKKDGIGTVYLTTFRIIFVPTKMTSDFFSFDLPISNIFKQDVQFPLFGCTYLKGQCKPYRNMLPGQIGFKLTFKKGGCDTFIRLFSALIKQTRKRLSQKMIFQNCPMYQEIRSGRFNFNAFVNPNDPSRIYTSQPSCLPQNQQQQQTQSHNNNAWLPQTEQQQNGNNNVYLKQQQQLHNLKNSPPAYFNNNESINYKNNQQKQTPILNNPCLQKQQFLQPLQNIEEKNQQNFDLLYVNDVGPQKNQQDHPSQIKNSPIVDQPLIEPVKQQKVLMYMQNIQNNPYYPQICCFAYFINRIFKEYQTANPGSFDQFQALLYKPMNPKTFAHRLSSGFIFCQILNICGTMLGNTTLPVSPSAINFKPGQSDKMENINLALDTAKFMGSYINEICQTRIVNGSLKDILSFVWELIKIYIKSIIVVTQYPQIGVLFIDSELDHTLILAQSFRKIFLNWLTYHDPANKNKYCQFDHNLIGGYVALFTNLGLISNSIFDQSQSNQVNKLLEICRSAKVDTPIFWSDLLTDKQYFHIIFCFDLFRFNHGLTLNKLEASNMENLITKSRQISTLKEREIKMFNNWIGSLGLKNIEKTTNSDDLIEKLKDGSILLSIIDQLRPNSVDWVNRFSNKLNSRIHMVQNCNYAIELCTGILGIKLVNVSGVDIVDQKMNLVLGVVWQLCNIYWEQRVGVISNQQLVLWANSKVPSSKHIASLQDPLIASGIYILHLINGIKPNAVDFTKIKAADTKENIIDNINYSFACARKMGAQILVLWEHVLERNSKFIRLVIGELKRLSELHNDCI